MMKKIRLVRLMRVMGRQALRIFVGSFKGEAEGSIAVIGLLLIVFVVVMIP